MQHLQCILSIHAHHLTHNMPSSLPLHSTSPQHHMPPPQRMGWNNTSVMPSTTPPFVYIIFQPCSHPPKHHQPPPHRMGWSNISVRPCQIHFTQYTSHSSNISAMHCQQHLSLYIYYIPATLPSSAAPPATPHRMGWSNTSARPCQQQLPLYIIFQQTYHPPQHDQAPPHRIIWSNTSARPCQQHLPLFIHYIPAILPSSPA